MQLVFLGFQIVEESANPAEARPALDDVILFFVCEIAERHGHAHLAALGRRRRPLQLPEPLAALRLGPWLHRAFFQREPLIGNRQVHVVIDGVAETLAARASSGGTVKAEQYRLGLDEFDAALLAREFLGEAQPLGRTGVLENHFTRFAVSDFRGIGQALVQIRRNGNAIRQHV